jgi:type IV pilus assembly protein PilF
VRLAVAMLVALALSACASGPADLPNDGRDLKQAAKINAQLGLEYLRKGDLKLAEEKLRRAIQEDPKLTLGYSGLGIVYSRRGQDEDARAAFKKALSLEPNNPDALNNYGSFLCAQGKADEAEAMFLKAASNRDNLKTELAWTNAAACARATAPEKAEEYLREALKANAEFPDALALFAIITYQKSDYLRTRAFLQRYEAVAPPSPNTLWLRYRTEAALGDATTSRLYEQLLKTKFPEARFSDPLGKTDQ